MKGVSSILAILWLAFSLPAFGQTTEAPHRVAYVNVPWILENSPQVKAVEAALRDSFAAREEELKSNQEGLDNIDERLRNEQGTLSEDQVKQLERDLISGKRRLKIAQQEFQEDLILRRNEEINKLRRQISEVIQSVAKDNQVDMVFETAVVYVSDRVDISKEVLRRLEGLHQANGGAAAPASGEGQ